MLKKIVTFTLLLFITGILTDSALAGSYYNSRGLGGKRYITSAHALGMGGAMISLPDNYLINNLNPAGLVYNRFTRLSGDFVHEATWSSTNSAEGFSKYTNLNGISLAVPLIQDKLATALSMIPTSQFDYEYSSSDAVEDYDYTKFVKASGGLNKISFGFGYAPFNKINIGATVNYNFGKLEQTWRVDYTSDLLWDSNDILTRKMWGLNWTLGFIAHPTPNFYVGGVFSPGYKLTMQDEITNYTIKGSLISTVDASSDAESNADIPEYWGFGATYVFHQKYRVSLDYLYQPWSNFHVSETSSQEYQNSFRIGGGIERLPNENILATYFQKVTYRVGYFYQSLDFLDASNNAVTEYGASVGFGFPYYYKIGRIDVALRYGQRGDLSLNPINEEFFQVYISVIGGEKWFERPR
ncbi:MAG: OmpP1/FadL family transporter [Candidatus Zhuqueibacterota bacterium]